MKAITKIDTHKVLTEIHIADIHFGAPGIDPEVEFTILYEQFLKPIEELNFDILSIDGDIFHRKFQSTSKVIEVALRFVTLCYNICSSKGATFIIIAGTKSHDADQLSLFYHLVENNKCEFYIVEHATYIFTKGITILCIPEEYGMGKEYYENLLYNFGIYDTAFIHGTFAGSIYGLDHEDLSNSRSPVFSIDSFRLCRGPIIGGHVHTNGCFNGYMYYCSSPIRFQFGEPEPKGFLIVLQDIYSGQHYMYFNEIKSFRYDTFNIDYLRYNDPKKVTDYLDSLLDEGIDNIRIIFKNISEQEQKIIKDYYKTNSRVYFKDDSLRETKIEQSTTIEEKYNGLEFLADSSIDDYEKFVRFINYNKGSEYITIEKLKSILKG